MTHDTEDPAPHRPARAAAEVFMAFLPLGLTSFGGPVAHLGFFRTAFVEKRQWLSDRAYADLVALCQFLPGPASSQVGMAIGLQRAGFAGLVAAWVAFTLPSAIVLVAFAFGMTALDGAGGLGWITGVKAAVVAVVAQAVLGMAKNLIPDATRATIAAGAMVLVILLPHTLVQVGAILGAGLAGLLLVRPKDQQAVRPESTRNIEDPTFLVSVSRKTGAVSIALFVLLLATLPIFAATGNSVAQLTDMFYRSGALVFGGGHVVLPLLQAETVATGLVSQDMFLAGYGAAQVVPGPLFTFAAYLGAVAETPPTGLLGAAIALIAVFLPAALLVAGVLPFWNQLRRSAHVRRALTGVNAAVVGLLGAALYSPVFTEGVTSPATMSVAVVASVALMKWRAPAWAVVIGAAFVGYLFFS